MRALMILVGSLLVVAVLVVTHPDHAPRAAEYLLVQGAYQHLAPGVYAVPTRSRTWIRAGSCNLPPGQYVLVLREIPPYVRQYAYYSASGKFLCQLP